MKLKDKLWNWGHLEGSHNKVTQMNLKMSPEEFAADYGINKAFIVSYGGNIQPPFDKFADRFDCLNEIKWAVLGDAGTPLPEAELGNTEDVIAIAKTHKNVTGGVMDDFFSEIRMKKFPPEVLKKIKTKLNENGLDFWCVLYNYQLDLDLKPYIDCFDGVSFWVWGGEHINELDEILDKFGKLIGNKRNMLGMYLWDYKDIGKQPMNAELFQRQLNEYAGMLKNGKTEGIIFCSSTVGDADLESNKILKDYIKKFGNEEI